MEETPTKKEKLNESVEIAVETPNTEKKKDMEAKGELILETTAQETPKKKKAKTGDEDQAKTPKSEKKKSVDDVAAATPVAQINGTVKKK